MNAINFSSFSKIVYFTCKTMTRPMTILQNTMSQQLAKQPGAAQRLVWVDLEMTGLDITKDKIMEIACLVTDAELNVVATGPNLVIHQPDDVLMNMDEWCIAQHGETGLTEKCRNSSISVEEAERQVLEFVKNYVPHKKCPLAGNSIYMDRIFLQKFMPNFNDFLHYRMVDVSTIKELAKRWHKKEYSRLPAKSFKHRSMDDILESLNELKYYRQNIFKND